MSNRDKGLASMSKEKRTAIAAKGGKAVFEKGNGHLFDPFEAKQASIKSIKAKKLKKAKIAAIRLMVTYGFSPAELAGLSLEDYIYYGGPNSNEKRVDRLRNILNGGL